MRNCRAQLRADGLPLSRQVSHHSTNRLIMRLSFSLRHGRGGCHLLLARAFARFFIEASYRSRRDSGMRSDGMLPPSLRILAELPDFLLYVPSCSKGLSSISEESPANYGS